MTKRMRDKSRVPSSVRKTAMMGAAATMWIAAAPAFSADASATDLQAAIREILRTPHMELAQHDKAHDAVRLYAISIGNDDDIVVGADQSALSHAESVEDIDVVNTGNLTGGIGIEVSTGAINYADSIHDNAGDYVELGVYQYIYDDAGNVVSTGTATAELSVTYRDTLLNTESLASRISIDNSGSVHFSGREGISASNQTGESITIENSGDITSTQDTEGRVGIYATTETYTNTRAETLVDPGEFTYNADGQLTGVVELAQWTVDIQRVDMPYDGGAINIHNTGDIDMGDVGALAMFGEMHSAAIYAKGDGGTTVVNEGDLNVGRGSFGIRTVSQGNVSITNSGNIETGNASAGISVWRSNGNAGNYRLSGDTYVLNTGDITGGVSSGELEPGETAVAVGMWVVTPGANSEYIANFARWNRVAAEYNEILGYNAVTIYDLPNEKLYDTTTINRGRIELQDGGHGVNVDAIAGYSDAINEGTIIVGDGQPVFMDNNASRSAGVYQRNSTHPGASSDLTTINAETGIIVTGDDGVGLTSISLLGAAITVNEGSITTGNGVKQTITRYGNTYDAFFEAIGMYSKNYTGIGVIAYAGNIGSITVGDIAIGMQAVSFADPLLARDIPVAVAVNEGDIIGGENSAGMAVSGRITSLVNAGAITTGDFDLSDFVVTEENEDGFEMLRAGASASSWRYAELINYGAINVGDGKIGAVARSAAPGIGYTASLVQGEDGVITTGDHAVGARVDGNLLSMFSNEGRISVGDESVGVEITSGTAFALADQNYATTFPGMLQAANAGIIESGDNSTGILMTGVRDVPWEAVVRKEDPNNPGYYYDAYYTGASEVTSPSYLQNSGTVRVGANSTGVEIAGTQATAADTELPQLFNSGAIDAGQSSSTAIRANADNNLGSFIVNVGTIAGNVTFGAGNDRFTNTLMVNEGRVTHTGNILMNGSVIDFGAGDNVFDNDRGMVTLVGGDNLITGADVVMTLGSIEARNDAVDSSLTIDGNLSGDFAFGADFNNQGADQLVITGDVAAGSSMSLVLNATEQLRGETSFSVISVGGENHGDAPVIDGVTGVFADSVLGAEASYSEATGQITVTARFGMGHMGTSATSATTMAQNWWMQALGDLDRRDMQHIVGLEDDGVSVWATAFHEEGSIDPINDLQDVSFDQKLSGMQTGIEWKGDIGGGVFSVGPMFSYGNASTGQNANLASARGDASAYGLNAGYRLGNGFYVNASWQKMAMAIDFTTPGTLSNAAGSTDADGDGFNVELGYAHQLKSGLTLAPQLQYGSVDVELDDFTTGDGVYALTDIGGKHSLLRAGLSVSKTFETKNGSITPLADVSYLDAMDGDSTLSSNGLEFGSDASGSGYRAELGIAGRYKTWDITGRVGMSDTTTTNSALSTNLSVRYRW